MIQLLRITIVLIVLFFNYDGIAQNYNLFTSQQKYLYSDLANYYSVEFVASEAQGQDTTLQVYFYEDTYNPCITFPGYKIVKYSNGKYLLFNKNKDTIVIYSTASLNFSWKIYKYPNGSFLQATVAAPTKETVLNTEDSIKNIIIEHYGSDGIKTDAVYPSIKISKSKGLIQAPLFYNLPAITPTILLVGLENPKEGFIDLRPKEAFNFEVGDEFHYYYRYYNNTQHRGETTMRWWIVKIMDKVENTDNYQYTVEQWSKESYSILIIPTPPPPASGVYTTTTYSHTIENLPYSFNGSMPYTPVNIPRLVPGQHIHFATMEVEESFNNRVVKSIYKNDASGTTTAKYSPGLGMIYEHIPPSNPQYGIDTKSELVYYKKGSETWGAPLSDVGLPTSVTDPSSTETPVYLSNYNLIYNSPQAFSLDLYTSQGQLIRSYTDLKGPGKLSLEDLPPAIYLYILNSADKVSKGHFSISR